MRSKIFFAHSKKVTKYDDKRKFGSLEKNTIKIISARAHENFFDCNCLISEGVKVLNLAHIFSMIFWDFFLTTLIFEKKIRKFEFREIPLKICTDIPKISKKFLKNRHISSIENVYRNVCKLTEKQNQKYAKFRFFCFGSFEVGPSLRFQRTNQAWRSQKLLHHRHRKLL